MSSFHTKTIERILGPLAQQVSKSILLFEDSRAGAEIPDLEQYVDVVKKAVDHFVDVGRDEVVTSKDEVLRRDLPPSLKRVKDASYYLEEAVTLLGRDRNSIPARKKLIDGFRGILQGTSSVLLTLDMSEVREIIGHCRRVLNVLTTSVNVDSFGKLAEFVKSLTPCMEIMIKQVDKRQEELTIQSHSALLCRGIEQLQRLTPMFISALKLHINTVQNGLPGVAECRSNRDFLVSEMSDEIHEIIRGLQLTESDPAELFDDDLAALHVTKATFDSRLQFANDWLRDPQHHSDRAGEKALNQVINAAQRLAEIAGSDSERNLIQQLGADLRTIGDSLVAHRWSNETNGTGNTAHLSSTGGEKLTQLAIVCSELLNRGDRHNPVFRLARTLQGKLIQAQRWLHDPRGPMRQVGLEACRSLVQGARHLLASGDNAQDGAMANGESANLSRDACLEACDHINRATDRLYEMTTQPESPEVSSAQHDLALAISRSLAFIWKTLQQHLVSRVAETYTDLVGPLRQLSESACPSSGATPNPTLFDEKTDRFLSQCTQLSSTAELAAAASLCDAWRADALRCLAGQLPELGHQVVLAGRAAMLAGSNRDPGVTKSPHEQASLGHFSLMRQHWNDSAERMRSLVDEAVDANAFVAAQEIFMMRDTDRIEDSILRADTTGVVDATTSLARRANRILQVATREAENSEDPVYVKRMNEALNQLRTTITPMVSEAKALVTQISDPEFHDRWRAANRTLMSAVGMVKSSVSPSTLPTSYYHLQYQPDTMTATPIKGSQVIEPLSRELQDLSLRNHQIRINNHTHVVSPTTQRHRPHVYGPQVTCRQPLRVTVTDNFASPDSPAPRTEPSDTEAEEEFNFPAPEENQPIMAAAHALHREARLWSSRDNQLVAATKRMAALMAQLSQIVRGEYGTKKDLINVSMAIATASLEASSCAKSLANECTDRRIRSNLTHLSERILTIGNQLKILSTVKATMLESQGCTEDQENTESLVGNAQNLMQTVIEALHVAGGASIKLRVDSGYKLVWRPRIPLLTRT